MPPESSSGRALATAVALLTFGLVQGLPLAASEPAALEQSVLRIDRWAFPVQVPSGYTLELVAADLEAPRMVTFGPRDEMIIGSRSGVVYRLQPPYAVPEPLVALDGYPHSTVIRGTEILVARTNGVYRADYNAQGGPLAATRFTLLAALPGGQGHDTRTIRLGPDGRVYASFGIRGNCSDDFLDPSYPPDRRRGGIVVLDETGAEPRWGIHATGLRNAVDFNWHPGSGELYATNNGPDHLGFDQPPEYFVHALPGSFHGMPWYQFDGNGFVRDTCVGSDPPRPLADVQPPVATFPSHAVPMGIAFVPVGAMDPRFEGDAIVALKGSWATRPDGGPSGDPASRRPPKLVRVRFVDGRASEVEDLVVGFQLGDGRRWARPVGVVIGPDGHLYFTSDSGIEGLYRLRRK